MADFFAVKGLFVLAFCIPQGYIPIIETATKQALATLEKHMLTSMKTLLAELTHVTLASRKARRLLKYGMAHTAVVLMGFDAIGALGLVHAAGHILHICGATGATIGGMVAYLEE